MSQTTYAHCTKATPGERDVYPHTLYETRTIEFKVVRDAEDVEFGVGESFEAVSEILSGYGESKEEAVHDLQYLLMCKSRKDQGFKFC